jgi:hypothetical protein
MTIYPDALDHMLAAWNEPEPARARGLLDRALAPGVRFADPSIDVTGIDGFEANMQKVKGDLPGAVFARTSGVDSQHGFHRYHWAIHQNGKRLLEGFDVTQTDENNQVLCVAGFFGPIPEMTP